MGLIVIGALLLSGCAATTAEPTATPTTPTGSANAGACADFATLTMTIADRISSEEPAATMWESLRVDFDEVALAAEGTVQDRMLALVDDWPDLNGIIIWNEFTDINGKLQAVDRACAADGAQVDIGTLTSG